MHFIWDPAKDAENRQRHGISFTEAMQVFDDSDAIEDYDLEHSVPGEDRWTTIGWCSGRCLLVRVTWTDREPEIIRIISARTADASEQRLYLRYRS
jgi:uncharacterized DUF497 family protein